MAWCRGCQNRKSQRRGCGRFANTEKPGIDSFYFMQFNSGKKSLTCNLKTDEGVALVKKLVREANVFIENFAPGVVKRMGLDYEALKKKTLILFMLQLKGLRKVARTRIFYPSI